MVKITTLIENTPDERGRLNAEHGLSLWIEDGDTRILFDTGQSGKFVDNAAFLGVDLAQADCIVLSHAHYDHTGGLRRFWLDFQTRPQIFLSQYFFSQGEKFHESDGSVQTDFAKEAGRRYIGVDFTEQDLIEQQMKPRYVAKDQIQLSNSVFLFANFRSQYAFEVLNPTMQLKTQEGFIIDPFRDEIALGVKTAQGFIVLLGCAHPGFLSMAEAIRNRTGEPIFGIIGGTHLVEANAARVEESIEVVRQMKVTLLGLSHCTGESAVEKFHEAFTDSFVNCTGFKLIV